MNNNKKEKKLNQFKWKKEDLLYILLAGFTILMLVLFCSFCLDNLMHSDTASEVVLSKFLADHNELMSRDWYYSTEIRVIYSQLIMVPLFKVFSDFSLVKLLSIFIFYGLLIYSFFMIQKRFEIKHKWAYLGLALLFAPLSNEYLDMMFIGCFYTTQVICTYLVLSFVIKEKKSKKIWIRQGIVLSILSVLLGMNGLRYLASLYLPMLLAYCFILMTEKSQDNKMLYKRIAFVTALTFFAGIGFLINKFYLAKHYSFDITSEVAFVPLADVPERFMTSIRLMLEFMGYREIKVVTPLGMVNTVKGLFFIVLIGIVIYLWKHKTELLNRTERFLLYFFVFLFLINWYMLIFTNVLQQYRYWLPVYVVGVLLIGIFLQKWKPATGFQIPVMALFLAVVVLSSLYGELWQDVKYNDCEKRYGYMDFLEKNDYDFGYATFWNASVSEYLSDGKIHVGNLGGSDGVAAPYEWLSPKEYYQKGFHEGKCFLLLARTEEKGMLNGDFTVMEDAKCVYQDEYYAIYEGNQGMYLFSEE